MRSIALSSILFALAACGAPTAHDASRQTPAQPAVQPATAAAAPAAPAAAPANPFPHEESELKPDPAVRWGRLANGARYALMRAAQPPGKVSIRLHMASGSLLEDDDQQGLAHLLEHMAFNGTKHFAPGELIPRLQAAGIGFGSHSNAHTSFDETVYKLDLPDVRTETLDLGLTVMADQAGGLLLDPAEVSRERGVVLAELRDRDGPGMRLQRREMAAGLAGTRAPLRLPIGFADTIQAATAERLRRYYASWYRPERVTLAVVGDADLDVLEGRVKAILGAAVATGPVGTDPGLGKLTPGEGFAALHDAEADGTSVRFGRVHERPLPADSVATRREQFLRDLGESVLGRRLRRITETATDCPFTGAGGYSYQWLGVYSAGVQAQSKPGRAIDTLGLIVREYRRMAEFGPTAAELAVEAATLRSVLDQAVAQAAARPNARLADALYNATTDRRVFRSPEQERELGLQLIAAADPISVRDAFRGGWSPEGRTVAIVAGKDDLGADGDRKVGEAFKTAWDARVEAPADRVAATWGYAVDAAPIPLDLGPADAPWATGAMNGVAWAVKKTDFQPGQVLIRIRLQTRTGPHPRGLSDLAGRMFADGGLGKHTGSELAEVLAGSTARFGGLGIEDSAVTMTGSCQAKDLQRTLELLRAWLTDAAWRADAEARTKSAWLEQLEAEPTDLDASLWRRFGELTHADAPWRQEATKADVDQVGAAMAKAWLTPLLTGSPLSVAIVGDCDPKHAAGLAVSVLGGSRPAVATAATPEAARTMLPPDSPFPSGEHRITVGGEVARSTILISWPTADIYDIHRTRRLSLLAGCFGEQLRDIVRQQFGDAYSPAAWSAVGEQWRDQGTLQALASVAPARAEAVRDAILKIAADLQAGIPATTLEQVRQPLLRGIADQRRQNGWWLGLLSRAHEQPFRLEWQAGIEDDIRTATADELIALAKQYLVPAKALVLIATCPGKAKP